MTSNNKMQKSSHGDHQKTVVPNILGYSAANNYLREERGGGGIGLKSNASFAKGMRGA